MSMPGPTDGRLGDGDLGIHPDQLDALMGLIVLASRRARLVVVALPGKLDENRISIQVHQELQAVQNRLNVRYMEFHLEGINNPPGRKPAKIVGRIDFKVKFLKHFGYGHAYFGVEGKRVARKGYALMRYYVKSGIGKFAEGVYSEGHPEAVLLGYRIKPGAGVPADIERRLRKLYGPAYALKPWGPGYLDVEIVKGMVPRTGGTPIRLLHAVVRMH